MITTTLKLMIRDVADTKMRAWKKKLNENKNENYFKKNYFDDQGCGRHKDESVEEADGKLAEAQAA